MHNYFNRLLVSSPNGGGVFLLHNGQIILLDNLSTTGIFHNYDTFLRGYQSDALSISKKSQASFVKSHTLLEDIHDVLVHEHEVYIVGTARNEIIKLDFAGNEIQRWALSNEKDAWHINCLAVWNNRIIFSAFGEFTESRGYKGRTQASGFVQDLLSGERLISGLSQPHSLSPIGQNLLLANSEQMEILEFSPHGTLIKSQKLEGYTRGICVSEQVIYVGLSQSRNIAHNNLASAAIVVLDKISLQEISRVHIPCSEIYDLVSVDEASDLVQAIALLTSGASARFNERLADQADQISSLDQTVTQRDDQIASLSRTITECDTHLANATRDIHMLQSQLAEAETRIERLEQSRSWRITAPYRTIGALFKKKVEISNTLTTLCIAALLTPSAIVHKRGIRNLIRSLQHEGGTFTAMLNNPSPVRESLLARGHKVRKISLLGLSLAIRIHRGGSIIRSIQNLLRIVQSEGIGGIKGRIIAALPFAISRAMYDAASDGSGHDYQLPDEVARRILVADYRIPRQDTSAGERATVGILKDLCALGYDVTFLPNDMVPSHRHEEELRSAGVTVITRENGFNYSAQYVEAHGNKFGSFYLIRVDVAETLLSAIRRSAPYARIIFHAPDLYFLREMREANLLQSDVAHESARRTKDRELLAMQQADHVVVVSPAEAPILQAELPDVPVTVFPVLYAPIIENPPTFAERKNIFFLGGFAHSPNVNAVIWFTNEVWPFIHAALPAAEFHIIGAEAPDEVIALGHEPGVKVVGFVPNLEPVFEKLKVGVAPLLYGAGIKGKVAATMGAGIPSVCTDIAAEGMGIKNEVHALIENDPARFAKAVINLYNDEALWAKLSNNGRVLVYEKFGDAANRAALLNVLNKAHALPISLFSDFCQKAGPHRLSTTSPVDVSIIVPVYNKWHLTRACLISIIQTSIGCGISYELILADDGSSDETINAEKIFPGLRVIKTETNCGFLRNCNNAAKYARGRYILLLNNDTIVLPGWLESLYRTVEDDHSIAIAGSKLLYPDGLIQEAGAALFSDGTAVNVGRGKARSAKVFNIRREVDYISGASILIRKSFWDSVSGFDERYKNAYCEDSDLAMTARSMGLRVVYEPASEVIHFEHQSYAEQAPSHNASLQNHNIAILLDKWRNVFQSDHLSVCNWWLAAAKAERSIPQSAQLRRNTGKLNILYFSPFPSHPASHGNRSTILQFGQMFQRLGHRVHFALLQSHEYSAPDLEIMEKAWDSLDVLPFSNPMLADGNEIPFDGWYEEGLGERIRVLCAKYDIDIVFCSYIFQSKLLEYVPDYILKVIDTHDKMGGRYEMLRNNGQPLEFFSCTPEEEGAYLRRADIVVARREEEARYFDSVSGCNSAIVIPHVEDPHFLRRDFDVLRDVGIVASANRINLAIVRECLEAIDRELAGQTCPFTVHIAGQVKGMAETLPAKEKEIFTRPWVRMRGYIPDIAKFYEDVDIVVSPVTMGTGINVKTVQAMAYGMPLLTTLCGCKGIETNEPLHRHENLDQLATSLLDLHKQPDKLDQLAELSRSRFMAFHEKALVELKNLFALTNSSSGSIDEYNKKTYGALLKFIGEPKKVNI
jgi:GT2 family glycosyltransferase